MTNGEQLDRWKTALVVFDMQNGQIRVNDPQRQQWLSESNILENCVRLVDAAREGGVQVYYVKNNRRPDGSDQAAVLTDQGMRQGGAGSRGRDAAADPNWQSKIVEELAPRAEDFVVEKIRTGAFSGTSLDTLLRSRDIDTVIICGVRTTVGIATTVRDGRDLCYNMILAKDATGGIAPEDHQWMLEKVFPIFSRVRSVDEIRAMMA